MNTPEKKVDLKVDDSDHETDKEDMWLNTISTNIKTPTDKPINYYSSDENSDKRKPSSNSSWLGRMRSNVTTYKENKPADHPILSSQYPKLHLPMRSLSVLHIQKAVLQSYIEDTIPTDSIISIETQGSIKSYSGSINTLADHVNYSSKVYIEYEGKTHMMSMLPSIAEKSVIMVICS